MKIKKMLRILFFILIYLMSFAGTYGVINKDVSTVVVGNVKVEPYIPEGKASVTITASIKITILKDFGQKNVTVHLIKEKDPKYLFLENMTITGAELTGGDRIKFNKNQVLNFTVSGKVNADWSKNNIIIKIGEVYDSVGNGNKKNKLGDVLINLKENTEIISPLKIHAENMDFGIIIAGQVVDTKEHSRKPAVIEVEGTKNKNVIITIPNSTKIYNKNKDELTVNLKFRENGTQKILKNINQMNGKELTGKTEPVIIDGSVRTNQNNSGTYTGTFTVRAEYEY